MVQPSLTKYTTVEGEYSFVVMGEGGEGTHLNPGIYTKIKF